MLNVTLIAKLVVVIGALLLHEAVNMPEKVRDGLSIVVGVAALLTDPRKTHVSD